MGGPNEKYSLGDVYIDNINDANHRMTRQPPMKRYWPYNAVSDASYEITENFINYRARCVRLLLKFVP